LADEVIGILVYLVVEEGVESEFEAFEGNHNALLDKG
jgi:hypothetical protein